MLSLGFDLFELFVPQAQLRPTHCPSVAFGVEGAALESMYKNKRRSVGGERFYRFEFMKCWLVILILI